MIRFQCQCGKQYQVPEEYAGKKVRCKKCNTAVVIPHQESSSSSDGHADLNQLTIQCFMCNHRFKVSEKKRGDYVSCPSCDIEVEVPNIPMFHFSCSNCHHDLEAPVDKKGTGIQCPNCNTWNEIAEPVKSQIGDTHNNSGLKLQTSDTSSENLTSSQSKPIAYLSESGNVIFNGPFNYAFDLTAQTIQELKGKIVEADPDKGYIEGKFRYGVNLFGIRVCVSVQSNGQHCILNFKGKLKDAFDTFGHAEKKGNEVRRRFLCKAETLSMNNSDVPQYPGTNSFYPMNSMSQPNTGNVIVIQAPSEQKRPVNFSVVILGYLFAFIIPFVGLILGIICLCSRRALDGLIIILISLAMGFMLLMLTGL